MFVLHEREELQWEKKRIVGLTTLDAFILPQHACYRCGKLTHLSRDCNIVPKKKQSFLKVEQSTQESSAFKIDASEERKRARAEKAEAKAKEAAAKRAAEIRSVVETLF